MENNNTTTVLTKSISFTLEDLDLVQYIQSANIPFSILAKTALRYYKDKSKIDNDIRKEIVNVISDTLKESLKDISFNINTVKADDKIVNNLDDNSFMNLINNMSSKAKTAKKEAE